MSMGIVWMEWREYWWVRESKEGWDRAGVGRNRRALVVGVVLLGLC